MRKSFDFISECQGRAGEMCPASALLSGRLPQKIRQGKLGFFLFCYYFYLVFGIFLLFLYLRRNISAHCWQQSSELCSQSILQWLKTSWEWGGGSDRRGDLREIQGSHWECQGPGWWWVQSGVVALWDPQGAGFVSWWEYPHPSLVIWEQSCLVSCASVMKPWSSIPAWTARKSPSPLPSQAPSLCAPSKLSQPDPQTSWDPNPQARMDPPMGIWGWWFQPLWPPVGVTGVPG